MRHIKAGARFAILSAPAKTETVATVMPGVNRAENDEVRIISCASCTTNCIAPLVDVMARRIGVERAIMTTVHAYTSSQRIVDGPDKSLTRGRAGAANLVPTSTGAALATTRAVPELEGRFDGVAIRAPVAVGSIADVVFVTGRATSMGRSTRHSGRRQPPNAIATSLACPTTRWCPPTSSATHARRSWT